MSVPGVKFQFVDQNRPALKQLRTDICGFVAYTERGPTERAVKLTSWRQFLDAFGAPLGFTHGGQSVRLFFENGGSACYVARVTDKDAAQSATLELGTSGAGGAVTLSTAFSAIEQAGTIDSGPLAKQGLESSDSPGSWGNRISITVQSGGLGVARSLPNQPPDGASIRLETIAGFHVGSWVRLIQDGNVLQEFARINAIDTQLREVTWDKPVQDADLDYSKPVILESVEFSLLVTLDTQQVERHENLSLEPDHPRFINRIIGVNSSLLKAETSTTPLLLNDPETWPQQGYSLILSGGTDGLASVTRHDFLEALGRLEIIDEISLLCAPDLVLSNTAIAPSVAPLVPENLCHIPEALPQGIVNGLVLQAGIGGPVQGVRVSNPTSRSRSAMTDEDGLFTLNGLPSGQVTLQLENARFKPLEMTVQTFAFALPEPQKFELALHSLPPVLTEDEVFEVQQAMVAQGEKGLYRVAILDPPSSMLRVEHIQSWRARFDTSFAALYWPWVKVVIPGEPTVRILPPSGAVAGLIARMDQAEGPHRSAANRPFNDVQAVSDPVDDPTHALLNDLGINVIRATQRRGVAPQGARTLSSEAELRYLGVRRLLLLIAEAIEEGHQWAVFEPNTHILRNALRHSLGAFLSMLWARGAFAGKTKEAAYAIKCDEENNPPEVIDAGQLIAQIAVAPVRPYEFIRLRLGRTDRLQVQVQT